MFGFWNLDKYNKFTLLFIIFIIGVTFYGPVQIGSITIRNFVTVLMLLSCINHYRGMWIDRMFLAYIVFIFLCMISVLLDPYANPADFFSSKIFGYYLPCYVAYFATYIYFVKFNLHIKPIIVTLLFTGTLNAIVSILQFLQLNNVWHDIYSVLGLPLPNYLTAIEERDIDVDNMLGFTTTGLFQKAVANGYYLCLTSILSFLLLLKRTNIKDLILFFVLWLVNVIGLFVCQERAAFVLGLLGSSFVLFFSMRKSVPMLCIFVIAILYLVFNDLDIDVEDLGRFSDMSYSNRAGINDNSIEFIMGNLLVGGLSHYQYLYHIPPHNIFYNAFIYSGVFGGFVILGIFFRQCWVCFKNSLSIDRNYGLAIISIALLAYQGNSFAHNSSLITGDVTIWLLWGMISFGYCHDGVTKTTN